MPVVLKAKDNGQMYEIPDAERNDALATGKFTEHYKMKAKDNGKEYIIPAEEMGDALKSGKFDLSEVYDQRQGIEKKNMSTGKSLSRGMEQGALMNMRDELAGAVASPMGAAKEVANKFGAGFNDRDVNSYLSERDDSRRLDKIASEQNPNAYLGGNIATGLATSALMPSSIPSTIAQAAGASLGASNETDLSGLAIDTAKGVGIAGGVIGATKLAPTVLNYLAGKSEKLADALTSKATGATGTQAAKFAPGSMKRLREEGIVGFGNTVDDIAKKADAFKQQSEKVIDEVIGSLDARGVTASVDNVVAGLQSKADELSQVHGNEKLVRQINDEIETLISRGKSDVPLSAAEESKKVFQKNVNYASPVADKNLSKHVGREYRREVERAASAADPEAANAFIKAKQDYGLIAPIQEAAEKRALANQQVALGGMKDMVAAAAADTPGVIFRNVVAPVVNSSAAATVGGISKLLEASPQVFGKYAKVLTNAAAKGSANLMMTHQILQKDPEYQKILDGL